MQLSQRASDCCGDDGTLYVLYVMKVNVNEEWSEVSSFNWLECSFMGASAFLFNW